MQLKQLFADEDAVSPVIGVILMVAITVILAAVIGTFVLGLGENVQDSAPQANFQFEYDTPNTAVKVTHTGGEDVDSNNIEVLAGGSPMSTGPSAGDFSSLSPYPADTTISTGSSAAYDYSSVSASSGDTVRVVWTSPSGGTSNTIGQSTIPS